MIVFGKRLNREKLEPLAVVVYLTGLKHISLLELLHGLVFLRKLVGFLEILRDLGGQATDVVQYLTVVIPDLSLQQLLLHIIIHQVLCLGNHDLLEHLQSLNLQVGSQNLFAQV